MIDHRPHFLRTHECNAYCRGDEHSNVLWLDRDEYFACDRLRDFCDGLGVTFVSAMPAPEARPLGTATWAVDGGADGVQPSAPVDPSREQAWLLTWREATA